MGDLGHHPFDLVWERPGVLALSGEIESLTARKRAVAQVAALPGVTAVIDRLRVVPEMPLDDSAIREDLRDALLEDDVFRRCVLRDGEELLLAPDDPLADISFTVSDGVIALHGRVAHITLRRLASVVAWWVPGVRDVDNRLDAPAVDGDEEDDASLVEAVRLALGRDPFLAPARLIVTVTAGILTLKGKAVSVEQWALAEHDAWCVDGVVDVVNRITVA